MAGKKNNFLHKYSAIVLAFLMVGKVGMLIVGQIEIEADSAGHAPGHGRSHVGSQHVQGGLLGLGRLLVLFPGLLTALQLL